MKDRAELAPAWHDFSRLSRRDFLKYTAAAGAFIGASDFLTACGTSVSQASGGTLTVAVPLLAQNLDRDLYGFDQPTQEINMQVVEPLLEWKSKLRPDGNYAIDTSGLNPRLAESWMISADGRSITWNLRKGVKSPKGNELTADVMKWNYDRYFGLKAAGTFFMGVLTVQSPDDVKVVGPYSFMVTASQPSSLWLSIQPQHFLGPLDAVEYQKHATASDPWAVEFSKQNVVSFGAYQIESRTAGQQAVMVPNPNYYGKRPNFDRIVFKEVPESAVRFSLLVNGNIDVAKDLSYRQLADLKSKAGVKVNSFLSSNLGAISVQTEHANLADKRVRQALTYAIPYDDILKNVYNGLASAAYGPINQIQPTYDASLWPYKTDIAKAKSLMQEAGKGSGFSIALTYAAAQVPEDQTVALVLKSAFQQIGVDLTLDGITPAAAAEKVGAYKHDLGIYHGGSNDPDPFYGLYLFYDSKSPINWSRWKNDAVDGMLLSGLQSQDQQQRATWSRSIQQTIIDECPTLFFGELGTHISTRSNISGLYLRAPREIIYGELNRQ